MVALPPQKKTFLREKYGKKERMRDWTTTERPKDRVGLQCSVAMLIISSPSKAVQRKSDLIELSKHILKYSRQTLACKKRLREYFTQT